MDKPHSPAFGSADDGLSDVAPCRTLSAVVIILALSLLAVAAAGLLSWISA